jgi:type II secretory pathway pseudopilin PulG
LTSAATRVEDWAVLLVRFARLREDEGFTIVELVVGIVVTGIILGSIAAALIVVMRTTDGTVSRLNESHDVQIGSAYLAQDVQSADKVVVPGNGPCAPLAPLVDFVYGGGTVSYCWGTGTDGQALVTRTVGGSAVTVAHFASPLSQPQVSCPPHTSCPGKPDVVRITFTQASGNRYTLLGSRRMHATQQQGSGVGEPPPLTLLATGGSSPLWVRGGCKSGGVNADCIGTTGFPTGDLDAGSWSPVPLWEKLSDASDDTYVTNTAGSTAEARVRLEPVTPPADGSAVTLTVTVRAKVASVAQGAEKLTVTLYQLTQAGGIARVESREFTISQHSITDYAFSLNDVSGIDMERLGLGFKMSKGSTSIHVYGAAINTTTGDTTQEYGHPVLVVNGNLFVNSTKSDAVLLTGTKNKVKLEVKGLSEPFGILDPGACSGCTPKTVVCAGCDWSDGRVWTWFHPRIPDPLRHMSAPTDAGVHTPSTCPAGYTRYQPGVYASQLNITGNSCLDGGIYILKNGMRVAGGASVIGQRVMLYNEGGEIWFAGGAQIDLTAYDSYPYENILIFQARCPGDNPIGCGSENTEPIRFTGQAQVGSPGTAVYLRGVIYAPASRDVTLGIGGADLRVTAVIAQNITVTNGSRVTIG